MTGRLAIGVALVALVVGVCGRSPTTDKTRGRSPLARTPVARLAPPAGPTDQRLEERGLEEAAAQLGRSFAISKSPGEELPSHVPLVQFISEGRQLLACTPGGELLVWDASSRSIRRRHRISRDPLREAATDARGRWLAAATRGGLVVIADATTGQAVCERKLGGVDRLAVSPDGGRVAIAIGATIAIRLLPGLSPAPGGGTSGVPHVGDLAWSPDGSRLAIAGGTATSAHHAQQVPAGRGVLDVRRIADWGLVRRTEKPEALHAVAFHPARPVVAYGGRQRQIHQAHLPLGDEWTLPTRQPYWITTLAYDPTGGRLLVGDESCDLWLYRLGGKTSPQLLFHSKHHEECWVSGVSWSPDGKRFVLGCRPNSHAEKPEVMEEHLLAEAGHAEAVRAMASQVDLARQALLRRLAARDPELAALARQAGKWGRTTPLADSTFFDFGWDPRPAPKPNLNVLFMDGAAEEVGSPAERRVQEAIRKDPELARIGEQLGKLQAAHDAACRKVAQELRQSYLVHQFEVK